MLIALDKNNQRVSIKNASKEEQYHCPFCGETIKPRALNSLLVTAHFYHKPNTNCYDGLKPEMSEWHYGWQELFPEQNREIIVEKHGVKHRADVLINNTVIEFQHSPITYEEISERNNFYLNNGYNVVWVFDANHKIRNRYDTHGSINPSECFIDGLRWTREKKEFIQKFPYNVTVFLNYIIEDSDNDGNIVSNNILIKLKEVNSRDFVFIDTIPNIQPNNFLKEYGVDVGDEYLSISEILEHTKEIRAEQRLKELKEKEARDREQAQRIANWLKSQVPGRGRFRF